jgi:predicted nucleic acid-binding protein
MSLLVDTSFLFALINNNDRHHTACAETARTVTGRLIVSLTVLPEIAYLLDSRLGHHVMRQFVHQITQPVWTLTAPDATDLARAAAILDRYQDSRLDFVDATLVAIAERLHVERILTLDQRHFQMIHPSHCTAFELLPANL